jgi:hypothetical protein
VYLAAENGNAVDVFSRNASTGTLTQLAGAAGCVAETAVDGCTAYLPLNNPRSVAISPDRSTVYLAASGSSGVIVLSRGAGGALTPLPGTEGCVSEDGSGGACADGHGLSDVNGVTVSPDGLSVYAGGIVGPPGGGLTTFSRNQGTGVLTQLPGPAGCLTDTASASADCAPVSSINSPDWIAPSPDGRHVYVISTGLSSVTGFNRELPPTCSSASANVPFGHSLFLNVTCSDPNGDPITRVVTSGPSHGTLDGLNQQIGVIRYTPASGFHSATDAFTFTASDGTLTSAPATFSLSVGADKVAPRIGRASISPSTFAVGARAAKGRHRGTTIRFRLSEAARVTYSVQRKLVRRGHRRLGKAKRFRHTEKAGSVRRKFSGRIGRKALKPAFYRLTIVAVDPSGNRSKPRRIAFRILPAR